MPCASCCGSQADERSSFAEPSCRAHGPCSDHGWRPAAVRNAGAAGGWRWSARRADRRLSAQRVFFRCAHSLRRADRSVGLDPELYQLSRAYPFLALAFALTPALGCRNVVDAAVTCIVLILCGLFFIAG